MKIVYSSMGESTHMTNDRLTFGGVLGSIVLFILISVLYSVFLEDWLDDYLSDEFSPLAVVIFVVLLGGVLYVEYQKGQNKE